MILQRIRRAAAALALAATLALAAPPAHAAGWEELTAGPGWIETTLEWIARIWVGVEVVGPTPAIEKCGGSLNPDGCPGAAPPPQTPTASSSGGSGSEG